MKAENKTTGHNRIIRFTDIPSEGNLPREMEVEIRYVGESNGAKGIALDNIIIPAILKGLS